MKILRAGAEVLVREGNMRMIETAGRTCYKSEGHKSPHSADEFVMRCRERGHDAMLEHGDFIFTIFDDYADLFQSPYIARTKSKGRVIVSGNVRAWIEMIDRSPFLMNVMLTDDLERLREMSNVERSTIPAIRLTPSSLAYTEEKLKHIRETVRFTVDRGVSHELVRHRVFSFAQESTRYCNYSQDRFGGEISVIEPCYLELGTRAYDFWLDSVQTAERMYFELLNEGLSPQEARAVLPTSVKTELIMTGNLEAWKHFFDLRALEKTGPVHPQMAEVAKPLYKVFREMYPDVFTEDLR